MLAGGTIGYKTKFQSIISHLSTEVELISVGDTAKMILFFQSLLDELREVQMHVTVFFEDNTGALQMFFIIRTLTRGDGFWSMYKAMDHMLWQSWAVLHRAQGRYSTPVCKIVQHPTLPYFSHI